jgi:glycosyltransferase involved in cell wall biosynthesis
MAAQKIIPHHEPIGFPLTRQVGPKPDSPPYKIAFVSPCWHRGGLEVVTITHIKHLDRDLFTPVVVTGQVKDMDDSLPEGVELIEHYLMFEWDFPPMPGPFQRARAEATKVLRDVAPDIVIGQLAHAPLFAANDLRVPLIGEYNHCGWNWDAQEHPSDFIIAVSDHSANRVHTSGRMPQVPVYLIYNGIDSEVFRPCDEESRTKVRESLGIRPDDLIVGFSGRFSQEKKPVEWVSCLASMKAHRESRVRGLMVGPMWEPEVYVASRERAEKRGLTWASVIPPDDVDEFTDQKTKYMQRAELAEADIIHAHVSPDQMPAMYGAMDCLMHTRTDEPFGLIIPEALMCRCPVVAMIGGGIPEIYDLLGLPPYVDLCEPGDLDEMADTVVAHLHDGRVPPEFSLQVAEMFAAERMAGQFHELLVEKIGERETAAEMAARLAEEARRDREADAQAEVSGEAEE